MTCSMYTTSPIFLGPLQFAVRFCDSRLSSPSGHALLQSGNLLQSNRQIILQIKLLLSKYATEFHGTLLVRLRRKLFLWPPNCSSCGLHLSSLCLFRSSLNLTILPIIACNLGNISESKNPKSSHVISLSRKRRSGLDKCALS